MATAWEILTGNSTLPSGTAWDHLNNQAGGGGDQLTAIGPSLADINAPALAADMGPALGASLTTPALAADLQAPELESEV